jgi:hypothetical protein
METMLKSYRLECPGLPLAVYREVAAHLGQVQAVETELALQTSSEFNYHQSQVGGLLLHYPADLDPVEEQRITEILDYYSQQFGDWLHVPSP